jgi:hypothetical protein
MRRRPIATPIHQPAADVCRWHRRRVCRRSSPVPANRHPATHTSAEATWDVFPLSCQHDTGYVEIVDFEESSEFSRYADPPTIKGDATSHPARGAADPVEGELMLRWQLGLLPPKRASCSPDDDDDNDNEDDEATLGQLSGPAPRSRHLCLLERGSHEGTPKYPWVHARLSR